MSFQHASDGVVRYNVRTNLRSEEINPNISLKALVQPVRYGTYLNILSRICGDKFLCGFCECPSTTSIYSWCIMKHGSNPLVIHFKLIHQTMLSWICIKLTIHKIFVHPFERKWLHLQVISFYIFTYMYNVKVIFIYTVFMNFVHYFSDLQNTKSRYFQEPGTPCQMGDTFMQ